MKLRKSTRLASTLLVYILVTVSGGLPNQWSSLLVRGAETVLGCSAASVADNVCELPYSGGNQGKLAAAEDRINQYLDSTESKGKFHVQGWRWHTMSLVREAGRLQKLALKMQSSPPEDLTGLRDAADYVVGFNMKGLHKIEKDLFFPWVRGKMTSVGESDLAKAFGDVMDELESDRKTIEQLGASLNNVASVASDPSASELARAEAVEKMVVQSSAIAEHARAMLRLEDALLVPTVARLVPESEQKSFNSKVIRMLGLFDSRTHLVGMHEAVWELDNKAERKLFQESIPSIPQYMIPRWKRLLYEPRVGMLDEV